MCVCVCREKRCRWEEGRGLNTVRCQRSLSLDVTLYRVKCNASRLNARHPDSLINVFTIMLILRLTTRSIDEEKLAKAMFLLCERCKKVLKQ